MDALVAQYSRPAVEETDPFEAEAMELMNPTDHLSMKFAMPPVANVSAPSLGGRVKIRWGR